jgi:hypothetical protein
LKQHLKRVGEFLQKRPRQIIFFEDLTGVPGQLYKETVNVTRRSSPQLIFIFLLFSGM